MNPSRALSAALLFVLSLFSSRVAASPERDFWRWFQQNQDSLFAFERDQEGMFDRLATEMHKVDPNLTFEFGPKEDGRREFVISAGGIRETFPTVERLFAEAPRLPHWKFVKFRPRRAPADIEHQGMKVVASEVAVTMEPRGTLMDLTVLIPHCGADMSGRCRAIAYLLLDQALGEHDVETKVGRITVRERSGQDASPVSLSALPTAFDARLAKPKDQGAPAR